MGEVYRARDTRLDRTVAIKVSKAAFKERFAREAKEVAALNHPNICTLFDVGPNYLVMEFIEGTPLKGPLPAEKSVEYASQILDALDAAHRKGFVHRDLKPGNVLVTKQGIKLLDFGLAKQAAPVTGPDDATRTAVTGEGQIIGTLRYMAPEQLQGRPADARSDLFAFGCVLYELLSGKRAFGGSSRASVIAAIIEREPAPLDLHPPLGRVIRKCLAKDPDSRFQNARDLKSALAWAMEQQPAAPAKSSRWPWAVAVALVLGALAGWMMKGSRQAPAQEQAVRSQLNPPEGGQIDPTRGFAISPDGRSLAFYATAPGKSGLWVRPLDATTARLLPRTELGFSPFWSPDGRSIAYGGASKIWRVDVGGGTPIAICDAPAFLGGDWAPDGNIVLDGGSSGLFRVPASGGKPEPVTTLDAARGETSLRWPRFLPGGRILFYVAATPEHTGIYAVSLANPRERVRVVTAEGNGVYAAGHLFWLRGSTLVAQRFDPERLQLSGESRPVADPVDAGPFDRMLAAVSSSGLLVHGKAGGTRLTWVDQSGRAAGAPGQKELQPGDYSKPRISPDGRRVAVARGSATGRDLWMVDVEREAGSRFTFLRGSAMFPVWSPDGRHVMFRAGFPFNLYRKEASGAGTEHRVTESANPQWPLDWSRDGRLVLYFEIAPDTQRDLWVLPVSPDGKPEAGASASAGARPYLRTRFNEFLARFSPEPSPRWVAYTSDESGRDEVYIQAFPEPRGKFQISTGGGRYPEWSPDGRELHYVSADNKLMTVSLKLGPDSLTPSTPRELFALPSFGSGSQPYAVAPDGKRFLVLGSAGGSQPLEVITNWTALLKPGAPHQ